VYTPGLKRQNTRNVATEGFYTYIKYSKIYETYTCTTVKIQYKNNIRYSVFKYDIFSIRRKTNGKCSMRLAFPTFSKLHIMFIMHNAYIVQLSGTVVFVW